MDRRYLQEQLLLNDNIMIFKKQFKLNSIYLYLLFVFFFLTNTSNAQTIWSQLGTGLTLNDRVADITYNPLTDEYFIVTDFNGVSSSVYKLTNNNWIQIATVGNSSGVFSTIEYYNGSVYVGCVEMATLNGITINSIARYDGANWHNVGTGLTRSIANSQVRDMQVWNNTLFIGGLFDDANGFPSKNFAAIIDTTLQAVSFSTTQINFNINFVNAIGIYNNSLVLGCIPTGVATNKSCIFKIDTANNVTQLGSFNIVFPMYQFEQLGNDLYFVGQFNIGSANHIIKWDGNTWGGVAGPNLSPYSISVANFNNKLFVTHGIDIWEDYTSLPTLITTSNQLLQNIQPKLKKINECLFIIGNFDTFDSIPAMCIVQSCENILPESNFASIDTSFCSGNCVNFTNQSTRDSSWLWLFPGGTPASSNLQTPPQVCYNTPGTYSVTLITSNAFGSDTLTLPNYITVDPSPIAQINTNISTCEGTVVNLSSSGGTSYAWSGPNGFTSNLQNPTITNSAVANTGTYSVVVSNSVGCSDTVSTQININAVTPAVANSNSPLCAGQALNLSSNTAGSYSWSGPNGFTSNLQNPNINSATTNSSGTYTLIVTNSNGCKDTTTLTVNVLANNPVTVTSNGPLCSGQTLNLTSSNGSSYAWSGPNGFTSTLQNPSINNVVLNQAGNYSVIVTNSNGCTNSASLTVSISPNTPVTASSNSPICEGDNLTMNASAGSTYSWTGPNGFTSSIQNPTITNITAASSGLYSVTVTNTCGTGSSNTQVQVGLKPTAGIAVTQTVICEGDTVYLTANGGNSYYWYGPNGFNSILSNPTVNNFSGANAGAYYLVATNTDNCSDTTVVNLALNESTCFFIPSVFTPNNDGTNDTWVIEGMWQFPNCIVKVYNRWGQNLFESKGYASPWDGTFEGNECPIADYYYIIDLKNGSKVFTGTVTIKR